MILTLNTSNKKLPQVKQIPKNTPVSTLIMGILNMTPDSFSGDGMFKGNKKNSRSKEIDSAVKKAVDLTKDGADILDVGGESTRPGACSVSVKEELKRTIPLIRILSKTVKIPISIDTYKSEVAEAALRNGASIVNDISALRFDRKMAGIVKYHDAAVVLMHTKARPAVMQHKPKYKDVVNQIALFLRKRIDYALAKGIGLKKIIIDPGIGFGKTVEHNLEILNRLSELKKIGRPILVGTSRKSFIGKVLDVGIDERISGSLTSAVLACLKGASIIRVHDVRQTRQSILLMERILSRADTNS